MGMAPRIGFKVAASIAVALIAPLAGPIQTESENIAMSLILCRSRQRDGTARGVAAR